MNRKQKKSIIIQLRNAADKGDISACLKLGQLFLYDEDIRNVKLGIRYLRRASDKDDHEASHILAIIYDEGDLVERNTEIAYKFYSKAAALGNPSAMVNIGYMYEYGDGVDVNYEKAICYYEIAAQKNEPQGIYNLAKSYYEGAIVEKDIEKALQLFRKGVDINSTKCMHALGIIYSEGKEVEENPELAFNLFKKASQLGYVNAYETYAICLLEGYGTKINAEEGIRWSQKSIETGNLLSISNMGGRYISGLVVKRDRVKGIKFLKKAADEGYPHSIQNLLHTLDLDELLSYDDKALYIHSKTVAELGSELGIAYLAYVHKYGRGVEANSKRCVEILNQIKTPKTKISFLLKSLLQLEEKYDLTRDDSYYLFNLFFKLLDTCKEIKERHILVDDNSENLVAHFTTLDVVHNMLPISNDIHNNANHLRLYNIEYMNDPQEGMVLFGFGSKSDQLQKIFANTADGSHSREIMWNNESYSVYICSFTSQVDRLDLWRAYGRNGEGLALVLPVANFNKEVDECFMNYVARNETPTELPNNYKIKKNSHKPTETEKITIIKTTQSLSRIQMKTTIQHNAGTLYRIFYDDSEAVSTLDKLNPKIEKIYEFTNKLGNNLQNDIVKIIRVILSDILYLYKNKEYSSEEEVRLIKISNLGSDDVFLDNSPIPRAYIKSYNYVFACENSSIVIGPRFKESKHAELDIKYRLRKYNFHKNVAIKFSNVLYR